MTHMLEKVEFRIKPSATRPQFQAAMDKAQAWIARQKGFEYSTVSADDRDMTHLIFWSNEADAKAAQAAFGNAAETEDLIAVLDHATVKMAHYPIVHMFGPAETMRT